MQPGLLQPLGLSPVGTRWPRQRCSSALSSRPHPLFLLLRLHLADFFLLLFLSRPAVAVAVAVAFAVAVRKAALRRRWRRRRRRLPRGAGGCGGDTDSGGSGGSGRWRQEQRVKEIMGIRKGRNWSNSVPAPIGTNTILSRLAFSLAVQTRWLLCPLQRRVAHSGHLHEHGKPTSKQQNERTRRKSTALPSLLSNLPYVSQNGCDVNQCAPKSARGMLSTTCT